MSLTLGAGSQAGFVQEKVQGFGMGFHGGMRMVRLDHQNRDHHLDPADGAFRQVASKSQVQFHFISAGIKQTLECSANWLDTLDVI
jgi:hypothetical protein